MLPALIFAILAQSQSQAATGRTVLATVLNDRGQPMVDVETDDFVVRESGQSREVLSARIADYPVAILLDNSAAAAGDLGAIQAAVVRFINRLGDRPVAVLTFGDRPAPIASFSDDRATVLQRVRSTTTQPAGAAQAVVQAMADAASLIQGTGGPFSSIVVISGGAADSGNAPTALLAAVLESRAIVRIVEHQRGAGVAGGGLRTLAAQARGTFTPIFSAASFQVALDRLSDEMASEIMIDYIVPGNAPPREDVTVGVKIPGARVVGMGVR